MPRILIVDDDPISLRFLEAATLRLGHPVLAVADANTAFSAARTENFSLLIIDRNMPGLSGVALLRQLRAQGVAAPAIATSAELDTTIRAGLKAAGFASCLQKPLTINELREAFRHFLRDGSANAVREDAQTHAAAVLHDSTALQAIGGDRAVLASLRALFAQELRQLLAESEVGAANRASASIDRLHRLRASCGFCGAQALASAAQQLESALKNAHDTSVVLQEEFNSACVRTLAALDAVAS